MDYPSKIDFDRFVLTLKDLSIPDGFENYAKKYFTSHMDHVDDPSINYFNNIQLDYKTGTLWYDYWNSNENSVESKKIDIAINLRNQALHYSKYFDERVRLWYFRLHQNNTEYARTLYREINISLLNLNSPNCSHPKKADLVSICTMNKKIVEKLINWCLEGNESIRPKSKTNRVNFTKSVIQIIDPQQTNKWNLDKIYAMNPSVETKDFKILFDHGKINNSELSKLLSYLYLELTAIDVNWETFRDYLKELD